MTDEFSKLPDVDSIKGMQLIGEIVEVQYQNAASGNLHALPMTLPNALMLLSLLSQLPGADQTLQRAKEFREQHRRG